MQNIWYDYYITSGGLFPRSLLSRMLDGDQRPVRSLEEKRELFKKIDRDFVGLSRMGDRADERRTRPVVERVLKELLGHRHLEPFKKSRDAVDIYASRDKVHSTIVEMKRFTRRDLSRAPGGKPGETAPEQLRRYLHMDSGESFRGTASGIITNGRDWRLQDSYLNFIEFDLEAILRDYLTRREGGNSDAERRLKLFCDLFGSSQKYRRNSLAESVDVWTKCYTRFRKRLEHLLGDVSSIYARIGPRSKAKEIVLWVIFIRSLEDIGVLPATPNASPSEYSSIQLMSRTNWQTRYVNFSELVKLIKAVSSNKYASDEAPPFATFETLEIENWNKLHGALDHFIFDADDGKAFDFGDLYSREFGMIYVNLLDQSVDKSAYFTSPTLAYLAADFLKSDDYADATVIDPACGSGTLLRVAYSVMCRSALQAGRPMPGIRSLYGSDIEQASTLLAKMNLWLASARKGQSFPSLDSNIVTRDVFEACNAVAAERENRKTFLKEIWGIEVPPRLTVYLSNPPWGEDSDELDVRASGARAEVPEETKNAVADLSAEMTIEIGRKKITLEMGKTGNHYIPFLLIPFWDSFATKESNGLIAYSVILPDQLFIGYQRRSFRSYIWPTIRRYYGFMQNVEGTFEASTLDSAPAKTMRFGVLAGECKWENRNRIKVCFAKAEKPAPLPKRAAEIGLLPLFESNDDIEIWNELFESSAERLDLEWKKGELNRKLLKDLSNLKPFQGKNAVHIRASRKWNTKLSHKFDPTGVAEILHPTSEESRRKKIKLMRSKRLFFPSQTTFSDKNSNQFRVETDANVIATDHWLYLASENPDTLSKAESVLRSDLWFRLSRLISTRTSISVQYLNELGIPDIETQPKVEREAS